MTSAIIDSVDELEEWMKMNEDRLNRLVSGDNDKIEQEGGRTVRRYNLQINSGDAHAIWSYADIPLDEKPSAEGSEVGMGFVR
ncbi:hypothetical protein E4U51_005789 [Claviceps purpurea]|nr:hypothetical protein E4U51_005789 [Claviceps purpurea]